MCISPTVGISTLSFTKKECEFLISHLYKTFGINFSLCSNPDGKGWTIKIYKFDEIQKFLNLFLLYCKEIPSLKYKWDLEYRLNEKAKEMSIKYGSEYSVVISNPDNKPKRYSIEEEKLMCSMKSEGKTYEEIAGALGRSVYGIGYKLHQLKNFCV